MVKYHTVKSLRDKLNELIKQGYGEFELMITYDGGHGATSARKGVPPRISESLAYGNKVIFAEDDDFVKGFD